jgi:hypothetical protein
MVSILKFWHDATILVWYDAVISFCWYSTHLLSWRGGSVTCG